MTMNGPVVRSLSEEQERAINTITGRVRDGIRETAVGGLAGSGKTTIAANLPKHLGGGVAFAAYTGKAAKVLSRKFKENGIHYPTSTIHRLIYTPVESHCRLCPITEWAELDEDERAMRALDLHAEPSCHRRADRCEECGMSWLRREELPLGTRAIVVDEASMVGANIYDDLKSFRVPIVWVGDHGQLPPVKGGLNIMGRKLDVELKENHRQGKSPIVDLALEVRLSGLIGVGRHGRGVTKIKGRFFGPEVQAFLDETDVWDENTLVLSATNKTRVGMNSRIRQSLGFDPTRPEKGDRVICLRNNREKGIANGSTGTVTDIDYAKGGGRFYNATIDLDGEDFPYQGRISRDQFGEERPLEDRDYDLFDYGYAMTVHKAQGSEAERVVMLEERISFWDPNTWKRWLYTGVTRARSELLVVAPNFARR